MVPLWKLVLLCGILTGTSASLLGNIGSGLNVLDNLKPIVDDGRKVVDNTLDILENKVSDILPDLKEKLPTLQEPSFLKQAYEKLQKSKAVLSNVFPRLIPRIITFLKLKLGKYNIIDLKAELTPDGQGLKMKMPISTTAAVDKNVELKVLLDLLTLIKVDIDAKTDIPKMILEECSADPASIQLTPLDKSDSLLDKSTNILNTLADVPKQICPVINTLLNSQDMNLLPAPQDSVLGALPIGV